MFQILKFCSCEHRISHPNKLQNMDEMNRKLKLPLITLIHENSDSQNTKNTIKKKLSNKGPVVTTATVRENLHKSLFKQDN